MHQTAPMAGMCGSRQSRLVPTVHVHRASSPAAIADRRTHSLFGPPGLPAASADCLARLPRAASTPGISVGLTPVATVGKSRQKSSTPQAFCRNWHLRIFTFPFSPFAGGRHSSTETAKHTEGASIQQVMHLSCIQKPHIPARFCASLHFRNFHTFTLSFRLFRLFRSVFRFISRCRSPCATPSHTACCAPLAILRHPIFKSPLEF